MRFPQEVVVQRFLPTYRALLAEALYERDLPQRTIADRIGVTQAQVSKYLSSKLEVQARLADDPRVQATVETVADGLADGTLDTVGALAESLSLIARLQAGGPLADLHEAEMPELAGTGFDATLDPDSLAMQEHRVLTELRAVLRRLLDVDGLAGWIPHVGSNLAQARPGAQDTWDVAALPGRIDVVGRRPQATTAPRFGASRHVASVVLAVMDVHEHHRAALNIAYRDELHTLADAAGFAMLAFEPSYEARRQAVSRTVAEHVEARGALPEILYHEGTFGIEPVAYILGPDAQVVLERTRELLSPASQRAQG